MKPYQKIMHAMIYEGATTSIIKRLADEFYRLHGIIDSYESKMPPKQEEFSLTVPEDGERLTPRAVLDIWNSYDLLPKAHKLAGQRKTSLEARCKDDYFFEHFQDGICRVANSRFCLGENNQEWKATLDWFIKPLSLERVMAGIYDNKLSRKPVMP